MKLKHWEINLIKDHGTTDETVGLRFIDHNGKTIRVEINSNATGYITVMGDDRIEITPWATNMVLIRHAD